MFSAGFRPFFLLAAAWAALAVPVWLCTFAGGPAPPSAFPALVWHVHEMVFGFGFATVAGFLLTAIPNWTGRLPLRGTALASLSALWLAGRAAVLFSAYIGPVAAAIVDLAFPAALACVVAREIVAGKNWRNAPMIAGLMLLGAGSLLVHLHAMDLAYTAEIGNRLGLAVLLMLIALIGGRIVPSFTRNWLARHRPNGPLPAQAGRLDIVALAATFAALASWVGAPREPATFWLATLAGLALGLRLSRWQGPATAREPLLYVLHVGYGWLAFGLLLLGISGLTGWLPSSAALHALTVGAIGTMTLAVMTRATLGHTGRPLATDGWMVATYVLISLAAVLRILSPLAGTDQRLFTLVAGFAWSAAFLVFIARFGSLLVRSGKSAPASPKENHLLRITPTARGSQ
jgi:uncharacterized protein involved in response to NO